MLDDKPIIKLRWNEYIFLQQKSFQMPLEIPSFRSVRLYEQHCDSPSNYNQGPLLQTWINVNPSMDK